MAKMTPPLNAEGRFVVTTPYTLNSNILYKCIAIREFDDIEQKGENVYERYYEAYGRVDGQDGFSFSNEVALQAEIVTLKGQDGSYVYVPTTYITSYPDLSEIKYHHVILSVSLGPLPETFDTAAVVTQVRNAAMAVTGVESPTVLVHAAPTINNPTAQQAIDLEQTRLGNITLVETPNQTIERLNSENVALVAQILIYEQILTEAGLLP